MSSDLSELIQKVPVYRRLSDEDRAELAAVCQVQEHDRGDVVFGEGEPADDLFTVVEGRGGLRGLALPRNRGGPGADDLLAIAQDGFL